MVAGDLARPGCPCARASRPRNQFSGTALTAWPRPIARRDAGSFRGPLHYRFVSQRGGYRHSKRADDCEEPDANPCDKSRGAEDEYCACVSGDPLVKQDTTAHNKKCENPMTRPKGMDARRARSAGDKTLMEAPYEFTNLRELVGRGVGLVQRSARSGEQHEVAANATR
jgi:hypothetical protein